MSNLGLSIRISKNSLIELNLLQEKDIVVKFSGGREVVGRLQSWDKAMNLILDNTVEVLGIEDNK
jgi:U6 snRNA-associated Sm-like protein LSm7